MKCVAKAWMTSIAKYQLSHTSAPLSKCVEICWGFRAKRDYYHLRKCPKLDKTCLKICCIELGYNLIYNFILIKN